MTTLRIALAQFDFPVGDIAGNARRIGEWIAQARDLHGADLVLFPELALSGYPPEDLLMRPSFLADCEAAMQRLAAGVRGSITAVVGWPQSAGAVTYNAASVLREGRVAATYRKRELPNYAVFDERRYFDVDPDGEAWAALARRWPQSDVLQATVRHAAPLHLLPLLQELPSRLPAADALEFLEAALAHEPSASAAVLALGELAHVVLDGADVHAVGEERVAEEPRGVFGHHEGEGHRGAAGKGASSPVGHVVEVGDRALHRLERGRTHRRRPVHDARHRRSRHTRGGRHLFDGRRGAGGVNRHGRSALARESARDAATRTARRSHGRR